MPGSQTRNAIWLVAVLLLLPLAIALIAFAPEGVLNAPGIPAFWIWTGLTVLAIAIAVGWMLAYDARRRRAGAGPRERGPD